MTCTKAEPIKEYCKSKQVMCELATELGYCKVTACAKMSRDWTGNSRSSGAGHLAKVLEKHGYNVKATDLYYNGYGEGGVDFLKETEEFNGDILTNPPWRVRRMFSMWNAWLDAI